MFASATSQSKFADQFRLLLPFKKLLPSAISNSRLKSCTEYPWLNLALIAFFRLSDNLVSFGYDTQVSLYISAIS